MKKMLALLLFVYPTCLFAQIGLKAGINFANVTNASSINSSSRSGFHARQGYDYKSGINTGTVNLDYIVLPQFMAINITKYFQIQLGGQMAFLLNAKVDSSNSMSTGNASYDKIMSYYNRFDYGFGGGVEIHPVKGLIIGARINISMNSLYKDYSSEPGSGAPPSFIPKVDVKNNLFQFFAGWTFGKKSPKKK